MIVFILKAFFSVFTAMLHIEKIKTRSQFSILGWVNFPDFPKILQIIHTDWFLYLIFLADNRLNSLFSHRNVWVIHSANYLFILSFSSTFFSKMQKPLAGSTAIKLLKLLEGLCYSVQMLKKFNTIRVWSFMSDRLFLFFPNF